MVTNDFLSTIPENLKPLFAAMYNQIADLQEENARLRRALFGAKSEKHSALASIEPISSLFNEAEIDAGVEETNGGASQSEEPEAKECEKSRRRSPESGGRNPLPESLSRERVVHDLAEEQKICPNDGAALKTIGEDVVEKLEFVPAQLKVVQHVYPKYACEECEAHVARAPAVPAALPQAQCEPALLAQILVSKYLLAMPLYRQETAFDQLGLKISRTSLARWVIGAEEFLFPLIELIKKFILEKNVIHADETTVQVLKGTGKAPESKSYMWTLCTAEGDPPAIWYEYHLNRSKASAEALLKCFKGGLHVDGYDGYNSIASSPDIVRIGCWAHTRRGFDVAKKDGAKPGQTLASKFLDEIQKLFFLERQWKDKTPAERLELRQKSSAPIIEEIRRLLDENITKVAAKSKLAKAMGYLGNEWPHLIQFLNDGRYSLSNNRMENYIRPFTLGRKNWLFSSTTTGAKASAGLYSLIVSAKANDLDVATYLTTLLRDLPEVLPRDPQADLSHYLPWNWKASAVR